MKKQFLIFGLAILLAGEYSCKGKNDNGADTTTTPSITTAPNNTTAAPVEVAGDDQLRQGVTDATKDYPGVSATVNNGVVTLTGTIEKDRLSNLMQSINSLQPKQVVNNLNYK
jgi:osmotically-inducible protein OsmY